MGDPTLLYVLGNHLLIHLKVAGENGLNEGTSYRSARISSISFGPGEELAAIGNKETE